eukprot:TRINITY_DN13957_c0_g1_i1.p1 TRINITY_DN13957_c0_g1~~TRINITY_DN13957_c0_g1_i1.p1  ORF type:complete len:240 (-),score=45.91 TRINITY_DN13957_c0_g1_i1:81-800(-)
MAARIPTESRDDFTREIWQGLAHLVIVDEGNFTGHLVCLPSKTVFGLMGVYRDNVPPAHDCCKPEFPETRFDVTVYDFKNTDERTISVIRSGGDMFHLNSPDLTFISTSLKSGRAALDHIRKFFPKSPELSTQDEDDALVCVGQMRLSGAVFASDETARQPAPTSGHVFTDNDLLDEDGSDDEESAAAKRSREGSGSPVLDTATDSAIDHAHHHHHHQQQEQEQEQQHGSQQRRCIHFS